MYTKRKGAEGDRTTERFPLHFDRRQERERERKPLTHLLVVGEITLRRYICYLKVNDGPPVFEFQWFT